MSTVAELVRHLINAYGKRDDASFQNSIETFIAEERRKNHHVLADDIERTLTNILKTMNRSSNNYSKVLGLLERDLPKDKEKGSILIDVINPLRSLASLILSYDVREALDRLVYEQSRSDLLNSYGLKPSGKLLFCGPPGCGKTVSAEAVAEALYIPLVIVRFDSIISSYLGETSSNLRKVFNFAQGRKVVMLFDEFDAIGKDRTIDDDHGELRRVINSFLQMLDSYNGESILIAATNHQQLLDSALWRRFDEIIFFDKPTKENIVEILMSKFHQMGISKDIDLYDCAIHLQGVSHSDVERVANDALKKTILARDSFIERDTLYESISRQTKRGTITYNYKGFDI